MGAIRALPERGSGVGQCASSLLLGYIDDPGLSVFLQAGAAQFGSDAGLLVAPEGNVGLQVESLLIQTVPELIFEATAKAREVAFRDGRVRWPRWLESA